ncbi:MAG: valine--tRNA ligase [Alphaproteobacteria bacterium]|nr:valine--tRNA ligase [Alphaproteobacteria bacterium]
MALEKNYDPSAFEGPLYERWEKSGAFACDPDSKAGPYCIMIPPPNVTGSLHMGHALTFTVQDTLVRFKRMQGYDVLWQPGTDHAGIATQMVVERQLAQEGLDRRSMGRKAFLERVWAWKEESGGTITRQLRRLGASLDWPRERFTMDPALNRAVNKVFVQLYRESLIYKDKRLVNWDPKLLTAISDLEVEQREIKGHLWHFKYPVEGSDDFIIVATTRPETMLGDTAVAVHPEHPALKSLIGKNVRLPLVGRLIPIVGDDYADPEKGTGAVKITPAHDFNDFEVGKRHDLPKINIFDAHARLNDEVPEAFRRMDRFEARKAVVAAMEELGLLDKIEPYVHTVPHGDRSGVPIEPWLSEQWYCDAQTLAAPALRAVEEGQTNFVPAQWANTYYAWMRNIEPWCISRQLWWGHQIPAWYGPDGRIFVAHDEEEAQKEALEVYGKETALQRDEDVLDTWFSAALWPFSTLGWPEQTPELARYYPTSVLVTGFDIIFFWVARMMMMGLHFTGNVPFKTVYIHALVRDKKGQKMSKSKGNIIDPLEIIDSYGCDALRFTFCTMSTPGRNIKLDVARVEGNRNFATKLWSAARYAQMNDCRYDPKFDPDKVTQTVNQWITRETASLARGVSAHLEEYRLDLAAQEVYEFVWHRFCDWYLEFTKPVRDLAEVKACTAWVLVQILKILHPFMPFITEALWEPFVEGGSLLMKQDWPVYKMSARTEATEEINKVINIISAIRATRAALNVPAGAKIPLLVKDADAQTFEAHKELIQTLARLDSIAFTENVPRASAVDVVDGITLIMPLEGVIDFDKERVRLQKEAAKWADLAEKTAAKLANEDFTARAPQEVLEEHQERLTQARAMEEKLGTALRALG